jgi:ariadne-1
VNPSCGRAIQFLGAGKPSVVVECACGSRFCFACGFEQHNPITCEMLNKWRERNSDDEESLRLVKATSKQCFHCGFPTERNQGCNHMTCSRCRGEWCWQCRGDWKTHGSHTGGFYSCNKYDASEAKKIDDWAGKYLEDNKRFKHFFERFFNHDVSRRQLQDMASKLRTQAQEYGVTQHANYDAVGDAVTLILECRLILKYTYVYGFFLSPSDKGVPFFEYVQANAEGITERLAGLVNTPIEKLDLDALKNLLGVTRKYISNLAKAIENGLQSDPC